MTRRYLVMNDLADQANLCLLEVAVLPPSFPVSAYIYSRVKLYMLLLMRMVNS